jgi:hypothetical protein
MSETIAVGVVPAWHWESIAVQARGALLKIANGDLEAKDFPRGVMFDARAFLDSALEEAKYRLYGKTPSNPPASLNNYLYAMVAFGVMGCPLTGMPLWYPDLELLVLAQFIHDLDEPPHQLTDEERQMASKAAQFFGGLVNLP